MIISFCPSWDLADNYCGILKILMIDRWWRVVPVSRKIWCACRLTGNSYVWMVPCLQVCFEPTWISDLWVDSQLLNSAYFHIFSESRDIFSPGLLRFLGCRALGERARAGAQLWVHPCDPCVEKWLIAPQKNGYIIREYQGKVCLPNSFWRYPISRWNSLQGPTNRDYRPVFRCDDVPLEILDMSTCEASPNVTRAPESIYMPYMYIHVYTYIYIYIYYII